MKKFILILGLLISSPSCFAIANFDSNTGALVIRDVVVNEDTVFDSVTLQLNLSNGTFSLLDASLKDTSFPATPLDTFSESGLRVDFFGCNLSGKNQITCLTKVVAINQDLRVMAGSNLHGTESGILFDNLSNQSNVSTITALDMADSSRLEFNLIQGIPVEAKFIFNDINPSATSIPLFEPRYRIAEFNSNNFFEGISPSFTDIEF